MNTPDPGRMNARRRITQAPASITPLKSDREIGQEALTSLLNSLSTRLRVIPQSEADRAGIELAEEIRAERFNQNHVDSTR